MKSRNNQTTDGADARGLLEQHRRDIEALDRRILHLVCERVAVARQVGELKSELGVPLRNFKVERQVYDRFEQASGFLGLEPSLGRDLARFLIEKAVEEQATMRDVLYQGDALDTLVVGGKGGMGRWIGRLLRGQGHRVRIFDPGPGDAPFPEVESLVAARDADLVMVAVPMSVCAHVLEDLAGFKPTGVVAEMCSFKSHLAPTLSGLRSRGLRLVSFHPVFSPDVRMLSDRTIVFCSDGVRGDIDMVRAFFEETSARLVEMDIAEHDRCMALVLGMTHLSNFIYAGALGRSGVAAKSLAEVAGVTFQKQMKSAGELVGENPALNYEIQAFNSLSPEIAGWLRESVDEWAAAIESEDPQQFTALMEDCRQALEGFNGK
jgi:chorismate mutase/prephenate dehydrogenase